MPYPECQHQTEGDDKKDAEQALGKEQGTDKDRATGQKQTSETTEANPNTKNPSRVKSPMKPQTYGSGVAATGGENPRGDESVVRPLRSWFGERNLLWDIIYFHPNEVVW